ncbi:hypothetical protein J6590_100429 [Homalodisca vitripennis]|nr:hypothetical protein J6590_061745 [Homalodisca vitripennis]KAG8289639.1 hypothetical protein J6590_100429 [Homalodisca vitripennis]
MPHARVRDRSKVLLNRAEIKSNISVPSSGDHEDKSSVLQGIRAVKIDIEETFNAMTSQISVVQNEIKSMRDCVINLNDEQEKLQERCSRLEHANDVLAGEVRDLQQRLHDTEQHYCNLCVIIGQPKTDNIADAFGLEFRMEDISISRGLRAYSTRRYCAVRLLRHQGGLAKGSQDKKKFKRRGHPPIPLQGRRKRADAARVTTMEDLGHVREQDHFLFLELELNKKRGEDNAKSSTETLSKPRTNPRLSTPYITIHGHLTSIRYALTNKFQDKLRAQLFIIMCRAPDETTLFEQVSESSQMLEK